MNIEVMACTKSRRTHTHAYIFTRANTKTENVIAISRSPPAGVTKRKKNTTYNTIFKFVQPYPYNDLKSVIIGFAS